MNEEIFLRKLFCMHNLPRNYCHIKNLWTSFSLSSLKCCGKNVPHNLFMSKDKHKPAKKIVQLKNWWREWKANIYEMRDLIKRRSKWPLIWGKQLKHGTVYTHSMKIFSSHQKTKSQPRPSLEDGEKTNFL